MKSKIFTEKEIKNICKEYNEGNTNLHNLAKKYIAFNPLSNMICIWEC